MCLPCLDFTGCVHDVLCVHFTDDALKGHFGKVYLERPPLSVAVKVLCLQHVREVECDEIRETDVSISVRCNNDSCLASLDPVRTYCTIMTVCVCVCVLRYIHIALHWYCNSLQASCLFDR